MQVQNSIRYSNILENDGTMSILSLRRDMGLTIDIDLILPLSNSLNYSYLFFELIDNHFVSNIWMVRIDEKVKLCWSFSDK